MSITPQPLRPHAEASSLGLEMVPSYAQLPQKIQRTTCSQQLGERSRDRRGQVALARAGDVHELMRMLRAGKRGNDLVVTLPVTTKVARIAPIGPQCMRLAFDRSVWLLFCRS